VFLKREKLLPGNSVPDFAGSVIAASDKFISRLIKSAICQWKQVSAQDLEAFKLLVLVFHLFLNKLYTLMLNSGVLTLDQLLESGFSRLRNEWFLQKYLIDQSVNVSPKAYI
jgi:hypothetical protein